MLATAGVPVELDRDTAQRLAEAELADPAYAAAQPSLVQRAFTWLLERIADLLGSAAALSPGGAWGLLVLLGALAVVVLVARRRLVPARAVATTRPAGDMFGPADRSAAEHRAAADAAEAAGDRAAAVAERFRAIVRDLEERQVLLPAPARTADEAARAAAARLPADLGADLAGAARTFDAVVYGGWTPAVGAPQTLRRLEAATRRARPVRAGRPAAPAVPR